MGFQLAGLCFTDAEGIGFQHDLGLAALSYLIAVSGSYASLEMIERFRGASGGRAACWHGASAVALGGSIWSMHFIAILALRIETPLTYAPAATLMSLLIAIGFAALGLQITHAGASWWRIVGAGVTVGLGVAAMHYVGMSAVQFSGSLAYSPGRWALSLVVAVAAATTALWLSSTLRKTWQRAIAALVMGIAISGMHYVGMAAAVFRLDPSLLAAPGLPSGPVAAAMAVTTLALILCALAFVAADRRVLASAARDSNVLQGTNAQLAQANAALELGRRQFGAVLDNMSQGVCFFDGSQRLLLWNRRYAEIYSLDPGTLHAGKSLADIVSDRHAAGSLPGMSCAEYLTWREQAADSNERSNTLAHLQNGRVVEVCYQPMPDGEWVATIDDVTERRQAEASAVFLARHDALTRLPNRAMFHERLNQAIGMVGRGGQCAVLCLDLDHFKLVNDSLGHPAGDSLIQAAADRLQACSRETDTVARLGGDEFAIIQTAISGPGDAERMADRIIQAFHEPFDLDGAPIRIGISAGIAVAPGDGASAESLLKHADLALHLAKIEAPGGFRFFERAMDAAIQARRMLERDLRDALPRHELELYYQPLITLETGRLGGFEALLRWHHPARGMVSPAEFIPIAEETGLIVAIGAWVLKSACFQAESWPSDIRIAVNLSPVQFRNGDLIAIVREALGASGLRPDRLELEITESVLLQDTPGTLAALRQLRGMGIGIALDDFGTGYSSLSYLRNFPFNKIKIDQSFVRGLQNDRESKSIIRAITGLGQSLSMKTTAEGVETVEQLDILRQEGCTEVQGYFFSRPCPVAELHTLFGAFHGPSREDDPQARAAAHGPASAVLAGQ